jgi:hypothetical protein
MVVISPATLHIPAQIEPKAPVVPVALPLDPKAANVFDYAMPLQPSQKSIADYAPSLKAKLLANPATMGDQMLRSLESFHKSTLAMRDSTDPTQSTVATPSPALAAKPGAQPGPAAQHPGQDPAVEQLKQMFADARRETTRSIGKILEMNLVTTTTQQIPNTVNTLIRS